MTWKLIFNTATNKGTGCNRDVLDGEYSKTTPVSECSEFNLYPDRYQWDGSGIKERSEWDAEQEEKRLKDLFNKKLDIIDALVVEKKLKDSTFPHTDGHNYYSDFETISGYFMALQFLPADFSIVWKTADKDTDKISNIEVTLDKAGIAALAQSFLASRSTTWYQGEAKKKELKTLVKNGSVKGVEDFDVKF